MPWPSSIAYHLAITLISVRLPSNSNITIPPLRNDIAVKLDLAIPNTKTNKISTTNKKKPW